MKFWKNWPYWAKGGVTLVITMAIVSLPGIFFMPLRIIFLPGVLINILFDELFIGGTLYNPTLPEGISIALSIIFSVAIYFIIGTLFGWLYGKIKNRKQVV